MLRDITILHQTAGPATNKNGTHFLLRGQFNAVKAWLCLHRGYCKGMLFPAAGALGPERWEPHTEAASPLCESPLCWTRLTWKQRNAKPAASSPKMDKSAEQFSISCPFSRQPFPTDLRQCESQEGFSKTQRAWMITHLTCPTREM